MAETKTASAKQEIVPIGQQLSKLSEQDMNKLFNNESGGLVDVTDTRTVPFPLELGIVQKLTGDDLFKNPDDNDRKMKGKIFIRPRKVRNAEGKYEYEKKLTLTDFKDEISLTLLSVEFGVEIYMAEEREGLDFPVKVTHCRSKKMISPSEREEWMAIHNPDDSDKGYRYKNQVRLILTPYDSKTVMKMAETGENPFVTVALSGTDGWNTWNVINEQMTEAKNKMGIKGSVSKVLSSLFRITFSTTSTKRGANEYYIFDAKVSLNDVQEALAFEELVEKLHNEFTFFYNTPDNDPSLRDTDQVDDMFTDEEIPFDQELEVEDEKENEEEEVSEEDLPF